MAPLQHLAQKVALHGKKEKEKGRKMGLGALEVIILIIWVLVMAVAAVVLVSKFVLKAGKGATKALRRASRSSRMAAS